MTKPIEKQQNREKLFEIQGKAVSLAGDLYSSEIAELAALEGVDSFELQESTHHHSAAIVYEKEDTAFYIPVTVTITHGVAMETEEFQKYLSRHIDSNMGNPRFYPSPELVEADGDPRKADTLLHKSIVATLIREVIKELEHRAKTHDNSKLESPELELFAEWGPKLKEMEYGSNEYKDALQHMGVALQHHYDNNRHHPEFFERGVWDMNLIDLIEMLCDWKAASLRMKDGGDFKKSLEHNRTRFNIRNQLFGILLSTAELLKPKKEEENG